MSPARLPIVDSIIFHKSHVISLCACQKTACDCASITEYVGIMGLRAVLYPPPLQKGGLLFSKQTDCCTACMWHVYVG